MHDEDQIPIWLFIGGILVVYGILILGAGLYALAFPPPPEARVALFHLHADVWWGIIMTAIGLIYCVRFRPRHHKPEASHPA
ncbi:hypothetical protein [Planctomyces sp. SH-PL62]|uniref:hypothetical protein n=1 Tax=Planctomyces sp. SH-PL62 TaxID=1636152 RepID=UPI00078B1934|nr:hypothetical protein [Planctomyces sp. SH-PL62]AMV39657.1 hypothetical protein VT85_19650 [Planctomyces sp. SH-PL62]